MCTSLPRYHIFFFNDTATTEIYTLSLHDALPIYKVIGSRKFYERKEVKDMLAYLRLLLNAGDELSLRRIINVPNRKIGPKTLGEIQQWANEKGVSLYQAIRQAEQHPTLGKAAKKALGEFARLMND